MTPNRLPAGYFEALYRREADPWQFATRWYERRKRALTLAALPRPRYRHAFEPGCGIGTLTAELAHVCDRITATDITDEPLRTAALRLGDGADTVDFTVWALGDDWPGTQFDLIVFSEVCYYLDGDELRIALDRTVEHLEPDGTLLCVHWLHPAPDYPLSGEQVHMIVAEHPGLVRLARYRDEDMLLEVFTPVAGDQRSVAQREGIV
ncbi:SAM-dependent methyltransferase [Nocardia sp. NPDC005978]|uniref:SAM-dependent methyltransferase n=1 Tax=unclassified Nocardia TaxID=2637762 RepID=UPI0033A4A255